MGLFSCKCMAGLFFLLLAVIVQLFVYVIWWKSPPPLPDINYNEFWGPQELKVKDQDQSIREFKVKFENSMIANLKEQLKAHEDWAPPLEGVGFEYGFNSNHLNGWLDYWQKDYPFEEREKFFNQFSQFKTNIQGLNIHFIRVKAKNIPKDKEVVPLLLLHGWPGSVREFYETIPSLISVKAEREFAVEVIAPSLPGYGFSDAAVRPGMGVPEVAVIMRNLMNRLGYKHFYVQGGDWGSIIGTTIATIFPEEVLGFHNNAPLTMATAPTVISFIASIYPSLLVNEELVERMYPLQKTYSFLIQESGYMHIQATKPDTIGVALTDSPAGLLAYILEKFSVWTNAEYSKLKDGGLGKKFTKVQLIDNLMVYWSTRSITTSMRLYSETFNKKFTEKSMDAIPTPVPTWALQAKNELAYQPPYLLKFKFPNLINATVLDDGGHFIAFEMPEVFAEDVLKAINEFRKWHRNKKNEKEL